MALSLSHRGLNALYDSPRNDKGQFSISEELANNLFSLRLEHPRWTIQRIFNDLLEKKIWDGFDPSQATLYRFCHEHNLYRDTHLTQNKDTFHSFEYNNFGQLWIADFMDGPRFWVKKSHKKTYLHTIFDDCTRFAIISAFHFNQDIRLFFLI